MRRSLLFWVLTAAFCLPAQAQWQAAVEVVRDYWGVPHVFANSEADGFYGAGYAAAEDRVLQMELFRRRATGRLAELFGKDWIDSDRKFRIAGIGRYCIEAAAKLPEEQRGWLRAYSAGVNAFVRENPDAVARRFARLGIVPEPWTESDSICAWMAVAEAFDSFVDEGAVALYHDFQALAAQIGEERALAQPGMMLDDPAAIVPESEMAKNEEVYARLKARDPTPGFWRRSIPDELVRFSHAWAVDGSRSVTGKPLLESDPQTSVNNPPLWYEFHLSAGRFDVRGISVAGSPGMIIGFNRRLAWGATALGASSAVTFIERQEGRGYLHAGRTLPFERRPETIHVKGAEPVVEEVVRTRHGFVFNALARISRPGEVYVTHHMQLEDKGTSLRAMLGMMAAGGWEEFRDAISHYYSPGLHVVYADVDGNIGYQTLVHVPLTRRTPRMALEGWTGEDEITGRIPLDEMPNMLNPDARFISHANNLPVGSWYPYDLGIGTGGTGHSARSLRLVQLLEGDKRFSVETFESDVHRDDVQANVAALFPVARRLAEETGLETGGVRRLLDLLRDWDLRYRADQLTYPAAMALGSSMLTPYRRSPLGARLGGGGGGISRLARLVQEQFGEGGIPSDPELREYLSEWLQAAAKNLEQQGRNLVPVNGESREIHPMPYQQNGPLRFPALDPELDLVSPPLACGQGGTIWSQQGNSYTQIVDLADVDNSRSILPPGISEDPQSPFYASQMDLWVQGATHPAPLSREKVQEIAVSRVSLEVPAGVVQGPWLFPAAVVQRVRADDSQAYETADSPIDLGPEGERVFLLLFGAGIRGSQSAVRVMAGGMDAEVTYAGPQGFYEDLDQVNVLLPRILAGRGEVDVVLTAGGRVANAVTIEVH